jgi:hypothetical protein
MDNIALRLEFRQLHVAVAIALLRKERARGL